jgi:pimeloyl-ACP methyl ester carboxylesterase
MTARIVGHGPQRVVVSHGWIADSTLFDAFATHIDVERFSFAFPDHRGYGARIEEPGPCGIRESADDVLALADELGWGTFSVLGHSMGGMVAQWLMASASERLAAAVLVAGVPASGAKVPAEARRARMVAMESRTGRRELIDANTGHRFDGEWLDALVELSFRTTTTAALAAYLDAFSDTDFAADAQGASTPVLVIVGALDPGVRAQLMDDTVLQWYPRASMVELADTGHYPMYERPAELYREIDVFLSGCTSPR